MTQTFAHGINKVLSYAKETVFGTQAAGPSQQLRRVQASLSLSVQPIESQEVTPSGQTRDVRQGPRQVQGTLSGQLSPKTYNDLFAGLLRGVWTSGALLAAVSDSVFTYTAGVGSLSCPVEHLLAAGFKNSDVVRLFGTGTDSPPMGTTLANAPNLIAGAVADTSLTFADDLVNVQTWASGKTLTIQVPGKKLVVPPAGTQVRQSFTFEDWMPDTSLSQLYTGMRVTQLALNIPASGFVTVQASLLGQNMVTAASQVYVSPTAPTTTSGLTAVGGAVLYKGAAVTVVTGMSLQIAAATGADPVVGSNIVPEIYQGMISVRGSFTVMVDGTTDPAMMTDFLNENEVSLSMVLASPLALNAPAGVYPITTTGDLINIVLPRVKVFGGQMSDGDRALSRTYQFVALEQTAGGVGTPYDDTVIMIQDTAA